MTDGDTTIDVRTAKVCDDIKTTNIKLATVRVISSDETRLKGIATNAAIYDGVPPGRSDQRRVSSTAQRLATCAPYIDWHSAPPAHGCRDANEMVANSFTVLNFY
jgi:hypothetical protein